MGRVVVEGFDSLYAVGLRQLLPTDDVESVSPEGGGLLGSLRDLLPDVVLLNAARPRAAQLVADLVTDYPGITVITCTSGGSVMKVYPAYHRGDSYQCPLDPLEIGRQAHH